MSVKVNEDKNQQQDKRQKYNAVLHFMAGGLGGMVGVLTTQPLDVLKTRLQSSAKVDAIQQGHYSTTNNWLTSKTFNSLKFTFKNEGFGGLFRGLIPNLIGVVPSRAIYFSSYNTTKRFLENMAANQSSKSESQSQLEHTHPFIHILSASSAGIVVPTIMNPVFLVKTRIQLEEFGRKSGSGTPGYTGYTDCIKRIYHEEGVRGFYKGLTASFLGIAETALYFVLYERAKTYSLQYKHKQSGLSEEEFLKTKSFSPLEFIALSGSCKLLASAITYPHEVVRTRMRERVNGVSRYNGLLNTFVTVAKEEGYKGLYKGMGAHMIRVVPNAAIMFLTYESVVWLYTQYEE